MPWQLLQWPVLHGQHARRDCLQQAWLRHRHVLRALQVLPLELQLQALRVHHAKQL